MKKISLALCIDSRGGMMFNKRRQMKDAELVRYIVEKHGGGGIFIHPFSEKLFSGYGGVTVSSDPVADCNEGGLCFIEDPSHITSLDSVDKIIVFNFGIPYPADTYLEISPEERGFKKISRDKLKTAVHNRLTKEVYVKKPNEGENNE